MASQDAGAWCQVGRHAALYTLFPTVDLLQLLCCPVLLSTGQFLTVDPKGRACMISALEKQKFVYVLNRDTAANLTISSPLEAHKSHNIVFSIVGMDCGYDNPIFAAIELDYSETDQVCVGGRGWMAGTSHTRTQAFTHTCMHTHTHTQSHTQAFVHTCMHVHTQTCACACAHTHTHNIRHARTLHPYPDMCTHAHIIGYCIVL